MQLFPSSILESINSNVIHSIFQIQSENQILKKMWLALLDSGDSEKFISICWNENDAYVD